MSRIGRQTWKWRVGACLGFLAKKGLEWKVLMPSGQLQRHDGASLDICSYSASGYAEFHMLHAVQ